LIDPKKKIFVTGHGGLVGSALCRLLQGRYVVTAPRSEVDLTDPVATRWFFSVHRPAYVFHCAAWVGGIMAHTNASSQAIIKNSAIQNNVIGFAAEYGVEKLLFLGSACAYPVQAAVPISESDLLTGPLEESNKGYALCKILGHELCSAFHREKGCNFISAVPTNLYGLNDNYDPDNSHVIPGMIHRFHTAKTLQRSDVTLWGSGNVIREFLWADDLARACVLLMEQYDDSSIINVGSGEYLGLHQLASLIAEVVDYGGDIYWDKSKPDGTPIRFLDNKKIFGLGWSPEVRLREGLALAYRDYLSRFQ